ncbi:MAG TPA: acetate/propionate family kinase [Actinomycetota bacterium]|nr:acetate/propionate family kinase [Actinomycetota bacterium]
MTILVVNVGSTSLKYALYGDGDAPIERGGAGRVTDLAAALDEMISQLRPQLADVAAIAFKVVHGGDVTGCVLLDERALAALRRFAAAAPAHNPPYLLAIEHLRHVLPDVPQVGSFETGFHRTWSPEARTLAVPAGWEERYGLRRYGFHGASHRFIAERMAVLEPDARRVLSCHLGGSSSICAIRDGASVDASMGFSPQSGLPQAERVGDLDAFAVAHLAAGGVDVQQAAGALASQAGLHGLSGLSGDLQDLEAAEADGHEGASFALRAFAYAARKAIGALAAALGGVDAVAFSGGMGEHSPGLRTRICDGLGFLGIELDAERNADAAGEARISPDGAPATIWVLPTDEERIVVRQTRELLTAPS